MASKLTLLKCPQCGSNQISSAGEDRFQCNSCKSFFLYDSNRIYNITNNTYYNPEGFSASPFQKKAMLILSIISSLFIGTLVLIQVFRSSSHNSYTAPSTKEKEKQKIETATLVLSDTGPQIWKIASLSQEHNQQRYVFIKEDASTHKVLQTETLSGELDWSAYMQHPYNSAELFSYGRYCFLVYDRKSRIQAYYTANGRLAWDEKTFPQHFSEFNSSIVEVGEDSDRYRRFYINAANGLTYYYFADSDTVIAKEALQQRSYYTQYDFALKDTTFFSFAKKETADGKFNELYRIHKTASLKDPLNGYFFEYDYANNLKNERDVKTARIHDFILLTPTIRYFNPYRLYQDGKRVVVAYHADANEKGPLLISVIQADGTVSFTAGSQDTEPIRDLISRYNSPICYQNKLFFYHQRGKVEIAVLNLSTGKLEMHYKQEDS